MTFELYSTRIFCIVFFKQKTAYEMRISDWSSDVGSSDLIPRPTSTRTPAAAARHRTGARIIVDRFGKARSEPRGFRRRARARDRRCPSQPLDRELRQEERGDPGHRTPPVRGRKVARRADAQVRSEEHTSELQSLMRI